MGFADRGLRQSFSLLSTPALSWPLRPTTTPLLLPDLAVCSLGLEPACSLFLWRGTLWNSIDATQQEPSPSGGSTLYAYSHDVALVIEDSRTAYLAGRFVELLEADVLVIFLKVKTPLTKPDSGGFRA